MLAHRSHFPDPRGADAFGLVAETELMTPELLLDAYSHGLFPWSEEPVRWYSPDPRAIFLRDRIRLPRRLGKIVRRHGLRVTLDRDFDGVIRACAEAHRHEGEWISDGFVESYGALHRYGYAHSVEVWQEDRLVGGLYGVQHRGLFAGESMFHTVTDASKVAFAALVSHLDAIGIFLIDAQVLNRHTANLGAVQVRRDDYLWLLERAMMIESRYDGEMWPVEPPPFYAGAS